MTTTGGDIDAPNQPKPVCPWPCGGAMETTAHRGRFGAIPHFAICVRCGAEFMITLVGDDLELTTRRS